MSFNFPSVEYPSTVKLNEFVATFVKDESDFVNNEATEDRTPVIFIYLFQCYHTQVRGELLRYTWTNNVSSDLF